MTGLNPKGTRSAAKHSVSWLLANCKSVDEVRKAIKEQIQFDKGERGGVRHWDTAKEAPALGAVVMDAYGHGAIIELGKQSYCEYDLRNADRLKTHALQVSVRANAPHMRTDHLVERPRVADVSPKLATISSDWLRTTTN